MTEKTRYSDEELAEFKALILDKLAVAKEEYETMMGTLMNTDNNGVDDTSPTYKALEEGANTQTKEELSMLAARQLKFIQGLEAALIRIENKTYGICRETGKLIPKERLRLVHNAHLSNEPKKIKRK
ncbi:MAG: TraR/DksA family transcriptional regulator [Paraprevotella sp.]|nr:TraR/DksA family transcriptional regulator [Paraprevotella sp.]